MFGLLVPSYLLTPLTRTLVRIISTPVRIHTPDSYPCSDYSCPLTIEASSSTCATHQTGAKVLVLGSDAGHEGYGEYLIFASNTKAALLQDGWLTDVRFVAGLIVYAQARMARRYVVVLVRNAARAERHATGPHDMLRVFVAQLIPCATSVRAQLRDRLCAHAARRAHAAVAAAEGRSRPSLLRRSSHVLHACAGLPAGARRTGYWSIHPGGLAGGSGVLEYSWGEAHVCG